VERSVNAYMVDIVRNTREDPDISLGASPRATLCLYRAAQAWALYHERDYVLPDDVIKMATPVLGHRLVLRQEAKFQKISAPEIMHRIIAGTRVPR